MLLNFQPCVRHPPLHTPNGSIAPAHSQPDLQLYGPCVFNVFCPLSSPCRVCTLHKNHHSLIVLMSCRCAWFEGAPHCPDIIPLPRLYSETGRCDSHCSARSCAACCLNVRRCWTSTCPFGDCVHVAALCEAQDPGPFSPLAERRAALEPGPAACCRRRARCSPCSWTGRRPNAARRSAAAHPGSPSPLAEC